MPIALLTVLKFGLLALLYVFIASALRAVLVDLYGPRRRNTPPPRPAVAAPADGGGRRSRKAPGELVVHHQSAPPRVVALRGPGIVIGRAASVDIVVDDVYVSDEHAEVVADDGGWSVRDLGSTNGTFLNDAKVTRLTPLATGDQLRLGKTHIEVRR